MSSFDWLVLLYVSSLLLLIICLSIQAGIYALSDGDGYENDSSLPVCFASVLILICALLGPILLAEYILQDTSVATPAPQTLRVNGAQ